MLSASLNKTFPSFHNLRLPTVNIKNVSHLRLLMVRRTLINADCLVVVFAHGAMGHRIDPSWWTHLAIFRSSQCPTTDVKAVVCAILHGMVHIKVPLLLIAQYLMWRQRVSSFYLSGPLPYVQRHITKENVLSALLNKAFLPIYKRVFITLSY